MDSQRLSLGLDEGSITKNRSVKGRTSRSIQVANFHAISFLIRRRRTILVGLAVFVILVEIFEHLAIARFGEPFHFTFDLVLYTILVPSAAWGVLRLLERTETARKQADYNNDLHSKFSQSLGDARSWDELVTRIAAYPHQVAPRAAATLFVINPSTAHMRPEAACDDQGKVTLRPKISINPNSLPVGSLSQIFRQNGGSKPARAYAHATETLSPVVPSRYDLPIIRNDQQIGVLKLEYPPGSGPTPGETQALQHAAPVIALALEGALLQNLALEQAAASDKQRQQIAQNLHDTLAQNIGYLCLKLDQITGENAIREIGVVLQELERMRTTADEAYQQVRNTLDELSPTQGGDLITALMAQARVISQRAGFSLHFSQAGTSYALPPTLRQQILYIAREALNNIEKHACAHTVQLQFLWLETELIVKITDDGIGFNTLSTPPDGHYGLWIMQHRAQEAGGTLKIGPANLPEDGKTGTEVTLWIPRTAFPAGKAD